MIELLAPAGSYDSARAAVNAGADAVYMGAGQFGARAFAESVEEGRVLEALQLVHRQGRKLYLAANTLMKERELEKLPAFLSPFYGEGLDGVIVQDLGALRLIRSHFPDLPIHVSTQMTITGPFGAKWMEREGASRVVAARELSLEELKEIRMETRLELEVFVHGAICYCYSGQCLFSSMVGGRSGNRGRCAQPCRLPYCLLGEGREKKQYLMNLKDMCTVEFIPRLAEAGVDSMKIEGRMKSPVYTAGVVEIYRRYIDLYLEKGKEGFQVEKEDLRSLAELFDRGGFTNYLWRHNGREMIALGGKPDFRPVSQIFRKDIESQYLDRNLKVKIDGILTLRMGNFAKIDLSCGRVSCSVEGEMVQAAANCPLTEEIVRRQMERTGNTPFVFQSLEVNLEGDCFLPMRAINELRRDALEKLDEKILSSYRRVWRLPQAAEGRGGGYIQGKNGGNFKVHPQPEKQRTFPAPSVTVLVPDFGSALWAAGLPNISRVIAEEGAGDEFSQLAALAGAIHKAGKQFFYRLPAILRKGDLDRLKSRKKLLLSAGVDGLVLRNADEVGLAIIEKWDIPVILDASLYTWNRQAAGLFREAFGDRFVCDTLPLECNERELCERGCEGSEMVVYGYVPLMVTAGCIARTAGRCDHTDKILTVKDRKDQLFPVRTVCKSCYNVVYNSRALSLLDVMDSVKRLGPGSVRLEFSLEAQSRREKIVEAFLHAWETGQAEPFPGAFTKGHFKRGVD